MISTALDIFNLIRKLAGHLPVFYLTRNVYGAMHGIPLIYYELSLILTHEKLEIMIPYEKLTDVNDILYKRKVGGMSFYDIKGRGRAKYEPVPVGTGVLRYVPEFGYRTKVEVIVTDSSAKTILEDILKTLGASSSAIARFSSMMLLKHMILGEGKVEMRRFSEWIPADLLQK